MEAVARTAEAIPNAGNSIACLVFRVRTRLCALPLGNVVETMRPPPIEALPRTPPFAPGLTTIRGMQIPVVDARRLLSANDNSDEIEPGRLISVRLGQRLVGLLVDSVIGIRSIQECSLRTLPPLLQDAANDVISTIGSLDAELLLILNGARLTPDDVFARIEETRL